MSRFNEEFKNLQDKNETKIEELVKKHRIVTNQMDMTDFAVSQFKQDIAKMRQAGANNSNVRKQLSNTAAAMNRVNDSGERLLDDDLIVVKD